MCRFKQFLQYSLGMESGQIPGVPGVHVCPENELEGGGGGALLKV